jgi:hypothetical protein
MNGMISDNLINGSSESDSDDEFDELLILYSLNTRKKLRKSDFIKKNLTFDFVFV